MAAHNVCAPGDTPFNYSDYHQYSRRCRSYICSKLSQCNVENSPVYFHIFSELNDYCSLKVTRWCYWLGIGLAINRSRV